MAKSLRPWEPMTGVSTNHETMSRRSYRWVVGEWPLSEHRSDGTGLLGTPTSCGFTNGGIPNPHVVQQRGAPTRPYHRRCLTASAPQKRPMGGWTGTLYTCLYYQHYRPSRVDRRSFRDCVLGFASGANRETGGKAH